MAEDQGEKEEQKFEFDSAGEALGYISLDQARVLAMRTAREDPGAYGRRFRNVPMAFEVVEDNETEDHYMVTLSFRPQGQFTGAQGQEQFFIEKEGTVAHRQVLGLPVPEGGRRFPVVPVAIGLVAVVIAAVVGLVLVAGGDGGGEGDGSTVAVVAPTETPAETPAPTPTPTLGPTPAAVEVEATKAVPVTAEREAVASSTPLPAVAPVPTLTSAPTAPTAKEVVRFHDPQWETIQEHNAIAMYITQHGYGYPVEQITGTTGTMKVALPAGDLDVNMEMWRQNQQDWYEENVASGNLVDLAGTGDNVEYGAVGQILATSTQGIYVPTYVIEQNPGLESVLDLPNFIELFQDPKDPSKGVVTNCIIGWRCQKIIRAK